jgi:transposase
MREMSVTEQRYKAVQGVLADGRTVGDVASQWNVSPRTLHRWLARYEANGIEELADRSHRPADCPHQMSPTVEVLVLEMRRAHPYWGARRIAFELARKGVEPAPSESGVYRCQVFRNLKIAQAALDEWVSYYNTQRPHQSLADATPESRFRADAEAVRHHLRHPERNGEQWVSRHVAPNGIVCVDSQHISVGKHYGGGTCDVLVTDGLFQFWVGNELLKTVARTKPGPVRKKHAEHARAEG